MTQAEDMSDSKPGTGRTDTANRLPEVVGHDVSGQVLKAGKLTELHPAPPVGAGQ